MDGIQADTVITGGDASVKAFANTSSDAVASTTDGDAAATNTLTASQGLDLDNLTVGDSTTAGGYNVVGSAIADLDTTATVGGGGTGDDADASADVGSLIGAQFGDGTTGGTSLSVGGTGNLAGTAALSSDATATAVDGGAEALNLSTSS